MGRRQACPQHGIGEIGVNHNAEIEADGPIRLTWSIEPGQADGLTRVTVTSSLIPGPRGEREFSGGIVYIV